MACGFVCFYYQKKKKINLHLLMKDLINRSNDNGSAFKTYISLEIKVTEFKNKLQAVGQWSFASYSCVPSLPSLPGPGIPRPSLSSTLSFHISWHPKEMRKQLRLVEQNLRADLVWQPSAVWQPNAPSPTVPWGGIRAEPMKTTHSQPQICSEGAKGSHKSSTKPERTQPEELTVLHTLRLSLIKNSS